jgi:hypothetical protein
MECNQRIESLYMHSCGQLPVYTCLILWLLKGTVRVGMKILHKIWRMSNVSKVCISRNCLAKVESLRVG